MRQTTKRDTTAATADRPTELVASSKPQAPAVVSRPKGTTPAPVGVIYNPRARQNATRGSMSVLHTTCAAPTTKLELVDALRDFSRREVGVVATSGGDGTVRDVLTALPEAFGERQPRVAILPSGRTDLIAGDIGAQRRDDELARLLAAVRQGTLREVRRPLVRVDHLVDADGAVRSMRGIFFGAAGMVYATQVAQGEVQASGTLHEKSIVVTVAEVVRRVLTQANPGGLKHGVPMGVGLDGAPDVLRGDEARRSFFLAVGLRKPFIGNATPFRGLPSDPELLHVLDVQGPLRGVARALATMFAGYPGLAGKRWRRAAARSVTLDGVHEVVLDGELFTPADGGRLTLHADGPVTFVTP